ncbi:ABC transporter ATP-binding protein [Exiguobacterium sp. SL-10]|uniref:ABC transporter ATP-binding protein n=1 Tax=unclassified Exiguobacterium TaxID=2644629 RepID=UPI00103AFC5A|nr:MULTISPECIES: dipeptide/oligopeptide/nickel ABC transporter ATP-binding protein [unclassified Exiguobacterium]TCI23016.1 ABC transporter ATP-binding protein [Exiguobacterium sp. SL-9]TCI32044.1 ABC transporter ATP-binding protein [Exiguobacterium sp. SL-10]
MLLHVENVSKNYNDQPVLRDVTFTVQAGESVGLIGTSGSGKSTLSRCILGLESIDAGEIRLCDLSWHTASRKEIKSMRQRVQAVFQDSSESFNPRWTLTDSILEPLRHFRMIEPSEEATKLAHLCDIVELPYTCMTSYPRELSGGQKQRAAIARSLSLNPQLVLLDEATTALDTLTQHHIVEMLQSYHRDQSTAFLIISHDLSVVSKLCNRILVLSEGTIVDAFCTDELFDDARHPYTTALRDAFVEKGRSLNGLG